jgi:hypothetical protein
MGIVHSSSGAQQPAQAPCAGVNLISESLATLDDLLHAAETFNYSCMQFLLQFFEP